jgi:hypothetical protein
MSFKIGHFCRNKHFLLFIVNKQQVLKPLKLSYAIVDLKPCQKLIILSLSSFFHRLKFVKLKN